MSREEKIKSRYGRDVMAGRRITHFGDCDIYACDICTCGLILDLSPLNTVEASTLYPTFSEEYIRHQRAMHKAAKAQLQPVIEEVPTVSEVLQKVRQYMKANGWQEWDDATESHIDVMDDLSLGDVGRLNSYFGQGLDIRFVDTGVQYVWRISEKARQ